MTWRCGSCAGDNPAGTRFCGNCGAPASATSGAAAVAARLPEQLRLVTALFADLSGFTSLSEKLDPETLSEIIGEAIRTMSEVVDRFGGTVLNYAGDAVLAGFGVPESAGDDAERAMAAALEMRSALAELLPSLPPIAAGLTLHIGINSGHAVARYTGASGHVAYTLIGDAVNTAQRLEAAAPSDEIYVGPLTAELGGRRFLLEAVGPLTMKGKAEPFPAWRLVARRGDAVRDRSDGTAAIVGRDEVLHSLAEGTTTSRLIALVGEPGIGKTATVQRAMTAGGPTRWVIASAVPYDAAPYAVWRTIAEQLPTGAQRLAAALSGDADPEGESTGVSSARQRAVHRAVIDSIRAAAPVVVVLDDLQWADPASLELARELAAEIGQSDTNPSEESNVPRRGLAGAAGLPVNPAEHGLVSIVLTSRPEGRPQVDRLLAEVPEGAGAVHTLEGLGSDEIHDLIRGLIGGPPEASLVTLIARRTGGSPFFATELVGLLRDQGRLVEEGGEWRMPEATTNPDVPPSVEELVQGRLDTLAPDARQTIELASVIGLNISLDLLDGASAGRASAATLEPLVGAGLLVRDPADRHRLSFRHGIVRDVAYHCTLRQTRRRLHQQVADAIGVIAPDDPSRLTEIALHLYEADAGMRAIHALRRASADAARLYANVSAVDLLDKAIELSRRSPTDVEIGDQLRIRRATLNDRLARYDDALAEFIDLIGGGDTASGSAERIETATVGAARTLTALGRYDEALRVLDGADGERRGVLAARASVLLSAGDLVNAAAVCSEALAARPVRAERCSLLMIRAQAYENLGQLPEALADAEDAERLAGLDDDPHARVKALRVLGPLYAATGRLDEAERTLREGVERATAGGAVFELAACLTSLSFVEQRRGNLAEAIDLDRRSVAELHRIGDSYEAGALSNLAHKLLDAADLDEAERVIARAANLAAEIGDSYAQADSSFALGRLLTERGDFEGARSALRRSLSILSEIGTTAMVDDITALLGGLTPPSSDLR